MLRRGGAEAGDRLSFFAADLQQDAGWAEAIAGCDYVLHVASPTLTSVPRHEDEMIVPAVEGVLRVLRQARDAGVKRVVLTSAFGAIGYGHKPRTTPFDETDWTELNDSVAPYQKSKTLAERAAAGRSSRRRAAASSSPPCIRSPCSAPYWVRLFSVAGADQAAAGWRDAVPSQVQRRLGRRARRRRPAPAGDDRPEGERGSASSQSPAMPCRCASWR